MSSSSAAGASVSATVVGKRTLITPDDWDNKLNEVKWSREDMNKLVMNFLVIEGYKEAAERFHAESGTDPGIDLSTITDRMAIRAFIQNGEIEAGIERVNDLNPEVLDMNPQLYFHLQQQRLIELIKQAKIDEAILFAQEELAPHGELNPQFLEELEKTMALLIFEDPSRSPLAHLVDNAHRQKTASELNAAILTSLSQEKDPKLPTILKILKWGQSQLDEKLVYPHIYDMNTAALENQ